MCLAVPGQIQNINGTTPLERTGKVSFGGVVRDVNLGFVPEAKVGDYVIVHVGIALSVVDQDEARKMISDIAALEEGERS